MGCGTSSTEFAIRNTGEALPVIRRKKSIIIRELVIPKIKLQDGILETQNNESPARPQTIGFNSKNTLCNRLSIQEKMRLKIAISKDMITDFLIFLKMNNIDHFENIGTLESPQSMLHYAMEMRSFRILMILLHRVLSGTLTSREIALLNLIDNQDRLFIKMAKSKTDSNRVLLLLEKLGLTIQVSKKKKGGPSFSLRANKTHLNLGFIEEHLNCFFPKKKIMKLPNMIDERMNDKSLFDDGIYYDEGFLPMDDKFGSPEFVSKYPGSILWKRLYEVHNVWPESVAIFNTSLIKNINSPSKAIRALFSSIKDHPDFIKSIFVSHKVNPQGIYSVVLYGTVKHEIVLDDLFPVSSEDPNTLICTSYESYEHPDITLPILEKCLAKFYGSYENLYKKADELGECVLYSVLFGMSYEIIDMGYSERTFSEILWGMVNDLSSQANIVKLRRLPKETSSAIDSFIPCDTDYNVILTFPATHVKMTLLWDWSEANDNEDLLDKLQFGSNGVMWKIEHLDEDFCYDAELFKDRLYYMTNDEISQNFDQVIVMYNMFPRNHKQIRLRTENMIKGDFYEIESDEFMEIHIEMTQELLKGWMNMALYQYKEGKLMEIGTISPSRFKFREPMRFINNNLVTTVGPGTYLLRCTFKPETKPASKSFMRLSPIIRITSSWKIKKITPMHVLSFLKKFEVLYLEMILRRFEQIEFKLNVFLHRGPVELDNRYYYVVAENKDPFHKSEFWLKFSGFVNCIQSQTKSMQLVNQNEEVKVSLAPESKCVFVFKEIEKTDPKAPYVLVEIIKK